MGESEQPKISCQGMVNRARASTRTPQRQNKGLYGPPPALFRLARERVGGRDSNDNSFVLRLDRFQVTASVANKS